MMKNQIFQATNHFLGRQPFLQEGNTEFFWVHPKDNFGNPDAQQLWPLLNGSVVILRKRSHADQHPGLAS
jgi:hypothetical protein